MVMEKRAYSIVGTNHTGKEDFVASLPAGTKALLVREPSNKFDDNAVAVWIGGEKVGYVPRNQNKVLAAFIDHSGTPAEVCPPIAMDGHPPSTPTILPLTITARFIRSPNSGFPMVEV